MDKFGFGRPKDGLIQTAFLVPDLKKAIDHWTDTMKGGPWFVLKNFAGDEAQYRGRSTDTRADAALGFVGDMQIELIQPLDDEPGIHQEYIAEHGYGFYHFGIACPDAEEALKTYESRGFEKVYSVRVPTGDIVYYVKGPASEPARLIELITPNDELDRQFTRMWRHSVDWDGQRRSRPFSELA